jgi:hypothetical protein
VVATVGVPDQSGGDERGARGVNRQGHSVGHVRCTLARSAGRAGCALARSVGHVRSGFWLVQVMDRWFIALSDE